MDVSDPSNPTHVGSITDDATTLLDDASRIHVSGKYAYVVASVDDGLEILDISDPSNPTHVGSINDTDCDAANGNACMLDGAIDIHVSGKYAYIAGLTDNGVEILDISNVSNPVHAGSIADDSTTAFNGTRGIYVSGKYAYVTGETDDGVEVLDVSDPSNPTHVGAIYNAACDAAVGGTGCELDRANGIYVSGKYAYIASVGDSGVEILDIGGIDAPAASIGNIETTSLSVTENVIVGNNLYVQSGLNVGPRGILSDGPVSFDNGTLETDGGVVTVKGNLNVTGTLYADNISSNSPLQLQTSGTTRIYIDDSGGNVGIGTSSPTNSLSVAGDVDISGNVKMTDKKWIGFYKSARIEFNHNRNGTNTTVSPVISVLDANLGVRNPYAVYALDVAGNIRTGDDILQTTGGTFEDKVDYTTGTNPSSVSIGDVDNDGYADLAVANWNPNSVSVFINNRNGTFATAVNYTTGTNPSSVSIGDVNNDGYADLAVTNYGSNNVSVFINNGDGTFAAKVDYDTGSLPQSVSIGDVNNDGYADMAVANWNSNSVSVFINNGDGTFATKVDYIAGAGSGSVSMGDVNNDGYADLAVTNYGADNVSVFINNGNGTFTTAVNYTTGTDPRSVSIGDVDNDGYADMAVTNDGADNVSVFINNGDGTFATKVDYTTGGFPYSVVIGDVDNDGYVDLAVTNYVDASVSVFLGNGDGTFAAKVDYDTGSNPISVSIGDVNNDGYADLAVANYGSNNVSVFINDDSTTFIVDESTGRVGIGTSNPLAVLHVNSTINETILRLQDADGTCNYNPEAGDSVVSCSSDKKLKKDIKNASSALEEFEDIVVKDYVVKASGKNMTGVIAQEINETHPEMVHEENGELFVELPSSWKLLKAIQELRAMIESLIGGNYSVESKAVFDKDSVGTATVLVNETFVEIEFSEEYEVVPIVTVTPIGLPNFFYGVDEITTKGFKILISEAQEKEVLFNWHAFGQELESGINNTAKVALDLTQDDVLPNEVVEINPPVSINETPEVIETNLTVPDEVNQTTPEDSNEINNASIPINDTEPANETIDIFDEKITVSEDNNESGHVSPITGGVIGTNNQDGMLIKLVKFVGSLFN